MAKRSKIQGLRKRTFSISFFSLGEDFPISFLNANIHKVYSKDGETYYKVFDGEKWSEPLNLSNSPDGNSPI